MPSLRPASFLFQLKVGYSSATRITPHITASVIGFTTPIIFNFMLTSVTFNVYPGHALAFGAFLAATGMIISMLSFAVVLLYYLGFTLYSMPSTVKIVRSLFLSTIVAFQKRTTVLATHGLMTAIGALTGPVIPILSLNYRNNYRPLN